MIDDDSAPHPRASLNQATIRYATLDQALHTATAAGYHSIGLWREPIEELGLAEVARRFSDSGLRLSSVCRAGYFPTPTAAGLRAAIDDSRRAIDETATLAAAGAPGSSPVLVIVAGGMPEGSRDLVGARETTRDAIGQIESDAAAAGVVLAIEALHPMMASDRGVISTLAQALDIAGQFGPSVGVVIDTYHLWWDPAVLEQIARAGSRIASYQVSDWATPVPAGALLGRAIMGEGVIDFAPLTRAVTDAGFVGDVEIEIFSQAVWDTPFAEAARRCADAFNRVIPLPAA